MAPARAMQQPARIFLDGNSIWEGVWACFVVVRADHDQGRLLLNISNVLRLGADAFAIPAADIDEPLLEELARTLLGHNAGLRKYRV